MKNFKIYLIALFVSIYGCLNAQLISSVTDLDRDNFTAKIITEAQSNTLNICIEKYDDTRILVNLTNEKGRIMFKRSVKKELVFDQFNINMTRMRKGNYTLIVADKYSSAKKTFKKQAEIVITEPIATKAEISLVALD
jgi:hypothetical protein